MSDESKKEEITEQKKIKLNEQLLTETEFEQKKKEVENMKGAELIEISPYEYRIRLHD